MSGSIRRFFSSLALAVLGTLAACGDGNTSGTGATGGAGTGGTTSAGGGGTTATGGGGAGGGGGGAGGMAGPIPDPGTVMGGEWTDVEPNDVPSQAVPVGVILSSVWMGFAEPFTAINPATDVDYFVFKTSDAASLANIGIQICWSFPGNLLDLYLYDVVNSQKGGLVKSATSTAASCETLIDFGEATSLLKADTPYLLEVVGAPGLDLAGDAGLYSA